MIEEVRTSKQETCQLFLCCDCELKKASEVCKLEKQTVKIYYYVVIVSKQTV